MWESAPKVSAVSMRRYAKSYNINIVYPHATHTLIVIHKYIYILPIVSFNFAIIKLNSIYISNLSRNAFKVNRDVIEFYKSIHEK